VRGQPSGKTGTVSDATEIVPSRQDEVTVICVAGASDR
jgi:hypothetical protein